MQTHPSDVLAGGGEIGARMRGLDWSTTPLGPVDRWPPALKAGVRILLGSPQPAWIAWGPERVTLYNDAFYTTFGRQQPDALGKPAADLWQEQWPEVEQRVQTALSGRGEVDATPRLLLVERQGALHESYYTGTYSPLPDDEGCIRGAFCMYSDDTRRVIGERQLALLSALTLATQARSPTEAIALCARALETSPRDLPFALIYLVDPAEGRAILASAAQVSRGDPVAPETIPIDRAAPWPLAEPLRTRGPCLVTDLAARFESLPSGPWDVPPSQALVLPIGLLGEAERSVVLVAGLSPYLPLDDGYRGFLELAAGQIAAAIAGARAASVPGEVAWGEADRTARAAPAPDPGAPREAAQDTPIHYAELIAGLDAIVWEADPRTYQLTFISQRAESLLGYPIAECLEDPSFWADHIHPDDRARVAQSTQECVERREPRQVEYRMIAADGRTIWLRDAFDVVTDDAGQPVLLRGVMIDVTERKQAEEGLREREQRLRYIFENAAVSIVEVDLSAAKRALDDLARAGVTDLQAYLDEHPAVLQQLAKTVRPVDANERTLGLLQVEREADLTAWMRRSVTPEMRSTFRDILVAIFEGRHFFSAEITFQTARGERRDMVFSLALPEAAADFDRVLASLIDVTEQRQAEAEAERVRHDVFEMLMQAPVPICVVSGPDLVFEIANPAYLEVVEGREIVGRRVLDALPELAGQGYDEYLRRVMRSGEPVVGQESLLRLVRDGVLQDTYWTFVFAPLRNPSGVVDRVMTICNEVTAQVRARQELEQTAVSLAISEERLRLALEAGAMGTWDWTPSTGRLVWSKQTEALYGFAPGSFDGSLETYLSRIHPADRAELLAIVEQSAKHGGDFAVEHRVVWPDGSVRWLICRGRGHLGSNGQLLRMTGTAMDITERRQAEQRLALQYTVARVLAEAQTVPEATARLVREISETLGWQVGDCWLIDQASSALQCVEFWHQSGMDVAAFEAHCRSVRFARGVGLPGSVWASQEPCWITDVMQDSTFTRTRFAADANLHGAFSFPVIGGGEVLGAMEFFSADVCLPDAQLLQLAHALGAQFGQFIERKRAEAALQIRTQHAELGAAVGSALTTGETLEVQLQRCAEAIVEHLDGVLARIWTLNEAEQVLELRASAGLYTDLDGRYGRVPVGQSIVGQIAQERQAHVTHQIVDDPRMMDHEWAEREGLVAFAGYPLLVGHRVVGVMALFARHPLAEATPATLASLADEIALGIDRAWSEAERTRLLVGEREARAAAETLVQVGQAISAELDQERLVQAVTDAARRVCGAQIAAFFYDMPSDLGEPHLLYAISGESLEAFERRPLPGDSVLLDPGFREAGVVRVDDVTQHEYFAQNVPYFGLPLGHAQVRSYLAIPVRSRSGEVLGGLFFGHPAPGVFTEQHERLVEGIAAQAAIALDNARLLQATQRAVHREQQRARQLGAVAEAGLAINASLSLDETLQVITERARTIVGARLAITSYAAEGQWAQASHAVSLADPSERWRDAIVLPNGTGIERQVCDANRPVRLTEAELSEHPDWQRGAASSTERPPLRGWLAAPLVGRGGANLGLIQLFDREEGEFTAEDEAILMLLAQLASVGLENSRLYQQTQAALTARDRFLATVSHDLRTPLTSIRGFSQMIGRAASRLEGAAAERVTSASRQVETAAIRMAAMVDELLDVAQLELGDRLELERGPTNLVELTHRGVMAQAQTATAHTLRVESSETSLIGHWDANRLERVLDNLISNAIKYSPGGGDVVVRVAREEDDTGVWAILSVQDYGIGIPEADLRIVFERFRRGTNASGQIAGVGLGLAGVRDIVEQHGGSVTVESQEGNGSTFTVRLPLGPGTEQADAGE